MKEEFTLLKALEIQEQQTKEWKELLRPEVYTMLLLKLSKENAKLTMDSDPYSVTRGSSIDIIVHNLRFNL